LYRYTAARLGELLCLPAEETEKHLSDLVTAKKVGGLAVHFCHHVISQSSKHV
jgi:hypothetical protein